MSYEETLRYIHSVKWQGSKPGLSRTRELLCSLGNPEKALRFVHIAGTNGKGSAAACLASVLQSSGLTVGLYTSPYINRFNERMQVNGEDITDSELERLTNDIRPFAEIMADPPTEFEMITALAMCFFSEKCCDIVVLETGLGGELDATNVIDCPEAAVITAIGLDHTQILGPTIEDIARAKAGIIKTGCDVIVYGNSERANAVFEETCRKKGAHLHMTDFTKLVIREEHFDGCRFDFGNYKDIFIPLAGTYQPYNAAAAITALDVLKSKGYPITEDAVKDGLLKVKWPGRFEVLSEKPLVILDGAHNPDGMAAAAKSLALLCRGKKIVLLIGVMGDKDIDSMLSSILPLTSYFVTVSPNNPRAMEASLLATKIRGCGGEAASCISIPDGVQKAVQIAGKDGAVCALGSLYFSADVRRAVAEYLMATL
ncbi:MAG: folylpolyglutamate synthase/dihydrofolate synthase family protein [Oscillospiraceae bacterium]